MTDTAPDTGAPPAEQNGDQAPPEQAPPAEPTDLAAELEKWKGMARKHEDRAKANSAAAKELEQLRQSMMSDTEKAVELARQDARREALAEVGGELVDMAVRAAVGDRPGVDVDALLEGLDRTRFITEDGKADTAAIASWVDRIVPKATGIPDLGQGPRGNSKAGLGDPLADALKQSLGIR